AGGAVGGDEVHGTRIQASHRRDRAAARQRPAGTLEPDREIGILVEDVSQAGDLRHVDESLFAGPEGPLRLRLSERKSLGTSPGAGSAEQAHPDPASSVPHPASRPDSRGIRWSCYVRPNRSDSQRIDMNLRRALLALGIAGLMVF